MADKSQAHSNTSSGKATQNEEVTVHEADVGMSRKASTMSTVLSSGEAARRVRAENKRKKEEKK
ncbi:hypothetical protein E4U42_002803 [Claviceps africana]|uniref:Uncharacterized protein n=1 Tax=Claviceps africana TaxID=83212 RepID=A0A8K0NM14_9HYPO|nr:hypothetical protein E4U42_002803 [Claviceps africana]